VKLFGQIVRTAVNVATLPATLVMDIFTLGGIATGESKPYTLQQLEKLKKEASEE